MKEFTYTIKEPVGIHARPAGMLAKEAKTCQSTVTIVDKNGKSVDATRLMALMGMASSAATPSPSRSMVPTRTPPPPLWRSSSTSICNSGIMYGRGRRSKTAAAVLI